MQNLCRGLSIGRVFLVILLLTVSCSKNTHKKSDAGLNQTKSDQVSILRLDQAKNEFYEQKYALAIPKFRQLLGHYNGEPEYFLALCYLNDKDTDTAELEAFKLLNIASDAGHPLASWEVGRSYENGIGVERNYLIALDWYRKHRELTTLGNSAPSYYIQVGENLVEKSYQRVFDTLLEKANNGDQESQIKIAAIFDEGKLVEKSEEKAFFWYEKAAKYNNSHAQLMLGYFYCRALGTNRNIKKANKYFKLSKKDIVCD